MPAWMKTKEVADYISVHRHTIWRWVKEGKFPEPTQINGCRRWHREEVDRYLQGQSVG